jgi:hypothetical protein
MLLIVEQNELDCLSRVSFLYAGELDQKAAFRLGHLKLFAQVLPCKFRKTCKNMPWKLKPCIKLVTVRSPLLDRDTIWLWSGILQLLQ